MSYLPFWERRSFISDLHARNGIFQGTKADVLTNSISEVLKMLSRYNRSRYLVRSAFSPRHWL